MADSATSKVKFQVTIWESSSPELFQRLAALNERQRAEEARYLMRVGLEALAGVRITPPPSPATTRVNGGDVTPATTTTAGADLGEDWGIGGALMNL